MSFIKFGDTVAHISEGGPMLKISVGGKIYEFEERISRIVRELESHDWLKPLDDENRAVLCQALYHEFQQLLTAKDAEIREVQRQKAQLKGHFDEAIAQLKNRDFRLAEMGDALKDAAQEANESRRKAEAQFNIRKDEAEKWNELQAKVTQLEASCAALRTVLQNLLDDTCRHRCGDGGKFFSANLRHARNALADPSGSELLERLEEKQTQLDQYAEIVSSLRNRIKELEGEIGNGHEVRLLLEARATKAEAALQADGWELHGIGWVKPIAPPIDEQLAKAIAERDRIEQRCKELEAATSRQNGGQDGR